MATHGSSIQEKAQGIMVYIEFTMLAAFLSGLLNNIYALPNGGKDASVLCSNNINELGPVPKLNV